jgi:hypothetical protein
MTTPKTPALWYVNTIFRFLKLGLLAMILFYALLVYKFCYYPPPDWCGMDPQARGCSSTQELMEIGDVHGALCYCHSPRGREWDSQYWTRPLQD